MFIDSFKIAKLWTIFQLISNVYVGRHAYFHPKYINSNRLSNFQLMLKLHMGRHAYSHR